MLVLYRTSNIINCDKMIAYWDKRCKEEGFNGIYIVEEKNSFQKDAVCANSMATIEFEPMYTLKYRRSLIRRITDKISAKIDNLINGNNLLLYKYDDIWDNIIKRKHSLTNNKKVEFLGAFVDWDNTPRKGKNGLVIRGATPEKFYYYFKLQIEKSVKLNSDFLFINAWNEWGEGTYLEPDEHFNYKYLEAIDYCLSRKSK